VLAFAAAFPVSLDNEVVELVDEGGVWSDLYHTSLKDQDHEHKDLGDGFARALPTVRNPYAQQVVDMDKMKKSYKQVKLEHRKLERMKYYATPEKTEAAVHAVIERAQIVGGRGIPSKKESAALDGANTDLLAAEKKQDKAERIGYDHFASSSSKEELQDLNSVKIGAHTGAFGKLYQDSMDLQAAQDAARLVRTVKAPKIPMTVFKSMYSSRKKQKREERRSKTKYQRYAKSKTDFNPKNSKTYKTKHDKEVLQVKLEEALKHAAMAYAVRKKSDPTLTYAEFVRATPLEGIKNFKAMNVDKKINYLDDFLAAQKGMNAKESSMRAKQEKFRQNFDDNARLISDKEFAKSENLGRQVKADVKDSEDIPEKQVETTTAKLKKQHEDANVMADVKVLEKVKEDRATQHDKEMASALADAPQPADLKKLEDEKVLGAEQLEAETKAANKRLAEKAARKSKKPETIKLPDYKKIFAKVKIKQQGALTKIAFAKEAKDARELSKSGSRLDARLLKHDQEAGEKGTLTAGPEERKLMGQEEAWKAGVRKSMGKQALEHLEAGIKKTADKQMAEFKKEKKVLLNPAEAPPYGGEALRNLPKGGVDSPMMAGDMAKKSFSGQTSRAAVPLNRDMLPLTDTDTPSAEVMAEEKIKAEEHGANKAPMHGYSKKEQNQADQAVKQTEAAADDATKSFLSDGSKTTATAVDAAKAEIKFDVAKEQAAIGKKP
jgi:hypothetical protein